MKHTAVDLVRPTKTDHHLSLNRRAFIALVAVEFVRPVSAAAQPLLVGGRPVAIEVRAQPITAFSPREPSRREFDRLTFRGGIILTSPYRGFGGISAIRVAADGADFIALSDRGRWFKGRILYEGERPIGIADAVMAPIRGPNGQALAARGWHDTESIAQDGDTLYVGIETVNQILRFDYGKDGLLARGQPIVVPPGVRRLPPNKGLEALVFVPRELPLGGSLIAISEHGLDRAGNLFAFLIGGPSPGTFSIRRTEDLDISDAALLPGGDLLILERSFNWTDGLNVRIRRVPLTDIRPGALVDGPELFKADLSYEIDNMEGLSVHQTPSGEVVLTLISDDNFSPIQRTLLLQFTLTEP